MLVLFISLNPSLSMVGLVLVSKAMFGILLYVKGEQTNLELYFTEVYSSASLLISGRTSDNKNI